MRASRSCASRPRRRAPGECADPTAQREPAAGGELGGRAGCTCNNKQGAHTRAFVQAAAHTNGRRMGVCARDANLSTERRYTPTRARAASSARSPRLRGRATARAPPPPPPGRRRERRVAAGGAEGPTPARGATTSARARRPRVAPVAPARRARRALRAPPPAVTENWATRRRAGRAAEARRRDDPPTRAAERRAPRTSAKSAPCVTPSASSVSSTWSSAHVSAIGATDDLTRRSSSGGRWSACICRRGWSRRVDNGDGRGAASAQGGAASAAARAARRAGRSARGARTSTPRAVRAPAGGTSAFALQRAAQKLRGRA